MGETRVGGQGSAREVFLVFLRLGLTSFGGPVAHLGYFREAFVERRNWLDDRAYVDLVALCQFLPGPASSKVGMALGLQRAGYLGLIAAWLGFTLPSALLLVAFALGVTALGDVSEAGWILGLKAAAVAVVAHAVLSMAKTLTPDAKRATIAVAVLVAVVLIPGAITQFAAMCLAGLIGLIWLKVEPRPTGQTQAFPVRVSRRAALVCLTLFALLLLGLPALSSAIAASTLAGTPAASAVSLADTFYRAGALVFGGGHVVLPLLEAEVVQTGLIDHDVFLAGYGAAQAVPGPLFTFAAYLGMLNEGGLNGVPGAVIALVAIFVPGALLVIGALPFWQQLRSAPRAQRALAGVNAGVVGLLAAALYTPVFTSGVTGVPSFAIAAVAFVALNAWKAPAWAIVLAAGLLGWLVL